METIPAKTILSGYADTAWFGANYNMNLYKGCCHGCIYCDSRSSCYRVERFDTVRAKENALEILRRELLAKRRSGIVHTGAMSDPYNPFEKEACLTAGALDLLARHGFGAVLAHQVGFGRPGRTAAPGRPAARPGRRQLHRHHGGRRSLPRHRAVCLPHQRPAVRHARPDGGGRALRRAADAHPPLHQRYAGEYPRRRPPGRRRGRLLDLRRPRLRRHPAG